MVLYSMFSFFSALSSEWVARFHWSSRAQETFLVLRIPGGKLGLEFVEAEIFQHFERELQAADDFVFDLIGSAEDVRVVLGKAAHAQQAVHHARALVAIDRAEFAQAHRQVAIGLQRIFVDQDVAGAIHGLEAIFGVVELHGVEHVLRVVALVARGVEQLAARHVRRADQRVAAAQVLFAHPVFHLFADDAALRMPEDQARARRVPEWRTGRAVCPARDGRASSLLRCCSGRRRDLSSRKTTCRRCAAVAGFFSSPSQ